MEEYSSSACLCLRTALNTRSLLAYSLQLQEQFKEKLAEGDLCMLPSYSYDMPDGSEQGKYLAVDVGGSTLRIALVQLHGRSGPAPASYSINHRSFVIDDTVRSLEGQLFFDWMAQAIFETLGANEHASATGLGVAWSFPVEQLSLRNARLLQMGKAFKACQGLLGRNLGDLIEKSCHVIGLNINVQAIVNDSSAILLAQTYFDGAAGMAVILGTGLNAALELPIRAFGPRKFTSGYNGKDTTIHNGQTIVVNTEVSMFGKNVFPQTSWDLQLSAQHPRPEFQPLEHFVSGRDIGEIVRFVLIDAIHRAHILNGELPARFGPYELATPIIAGLESRDRTIVSRAAADFRSRHPLPSGCDYTMKDFIHVRRIIKSVSDRAAAYVACAIHALWKLKFDLESDANDYTRKPPMVVSCNGSVLVKYPRFKERVQEWLDAMIGTTETGIQALVLQVAGREESVLIGAAVAVAVGLSHAAGGVSERARL